MNITIYTQSNISPPEFFDGHFIREGALSGLLTGITISDLSYQREHGMFNSNEMISFTVGFASNVAINLFANWLWEKLRRLKIKEIEIEKETIEIKDKEGFIRIVKEHIKLNP